MQSVRLNYLDSAPCEQPVRLPLLRTIYPARCRFFIEESFLAPGRLDPLTFPGSNFLEGVTCPALWAHHTAAAQRRGAGAALFQAVLISGHESAGGHCSSPGLRRRNHL